MALTNAEKQRRWREKRNDLATDLAGTPTEVADNLLRRLGPDTARKVAKALDSRLRNLRADCPACNGTGFAPWHTRTACGMFISEGRIACECGAPDPILRALTRTARRTGRQ